MDENMLNIQQEEIDDEIQAIALAHSEEAVYDGIISPKDYNKSRVKILWLAREPHDDGGDYDYKSDIIDKQSRGVLRGERYFNRLRYIQYSCINDFKKWDKSVYYSNEKTYSDLVLQAAFINCNKIPGNAVVNWDKWWEYVDYYKRVVRKQIKLASPKIIIACGTLMYLEKYGYLKNAIKKEKSYRYYYNVDGCIIVDAYHIAARSSVENYCNDIIEVLEKERNILKI